MIDETKLINELCNYFISMECPDGRGINDMAISAYDEGIYDAIHTIEHQPKINDWIPFTFGKDGEFNCKVPDEDEEVLVSDGKDVWLDVFSHDEHGYFFEWKGDFKGMAWMPKPEPWKGEV